MEEEAEQFVPDWAALPNDVLNNIYAKVFEVYRDNLIDSFSNRPYTIVEWPLKAAMAQIQMLSLVCKNWAQALADRPPALQLKIQTPRELKAAKWITQFPVKTLMISPFSSDSIDASDDEDVYRAFGGVEEGRIGTDDDWAELVMDCVHNRVDGLCISQLAALESLTLECPRMEGREIFNSEPIQSLQHLSELALSKFTEFNLLSLPQSVGDLTIMFRGRSVHGNSFYMVPKLPEYLILNRLRIISFGEVGVPLDELWNCCKKIELLVSSCLVGVPVSEPELVRVFEVPYREGRYVPPHILGDAIALELSHVVAYATLSFMLTGLANSSQLELLTIMESASNSVKLVPANVGNSRASVEFIQSVCRDKTVFLYGASQVDMIDRLRQMVVDSILSASALEIEWDDIFKIKVVREQS